MRTMELSIAGLGIILYSPFAAAGIKEGEDYLSTRYWDADRMLEHVKKGTIVGFGTGGPGSFVIHMLDDKPDEDLMQKCKLRLTLGIEVRDGRICFRDLYDLLKWRADCPKEQAIDLEDGFYKISLLSKRPDSGVIGDMQSIWVHFESVGAMPALDYDDVPALFDE